MVRTEATLSNPTIPENDARDLISYPMMETGLHRFAVALLRALFLPFMVIEVEGLENLPDEGGVVLAANHLTNFDVFPLQFGLPRAIFYMGKAELFQFAFMHWLLRNLCAFPVYRGERDQWALNHSVRILRAGQVLGIFPEGTRSHGRGLKVAKTGAARLAIETGCPIVPVALDGSQRFFAGFPRRNCVKLTVSPPIRVAENDDPLALTDRVMLALAASLPADLRGVYAEAFPAMKD
jgi:1-acyl-sn-glycerol-3-phosphate acyltransferase